MTLRRLGLAGLILSLLTSLAVAQPIWKWRDAQGRMQISDLPPPASVPEKDIVQRPGSRAAAAASAPLGATETNSATGTAPVVDKELEARKQKLLQEQAALRQAKAASAAERSRAINAENCRRATNQLKLLESGQRVARPNEKGEREIMDDRARAEEIQWTREVMQGACR